MESHRNYAPPARSGDDSSRELLPDTEATDRLFASERTTT